MKARNIALAALLAVTVFPVGARSPKRGVSENSFQFKAQMAALAPGVSWYYTWGNTPGRYLAGETAMEFVPMCWNTNYNADNIRTYVAEHPEVKYILGYNEPNFTNQSNLTPSEAAADWPNLLALANELGLKVVAPALNYSPNPPYYNPADWMDEFVALVGTDAFDYVALHNYGGLGVMKDLCATFHEKYGKEIWVTEFCMWPNEGDPNSYVAPEDQIASMVQTVEWLEKTDYIFRYAWFKPIGDSDSTAGPNYGLLISGKGEAERELSEQGLVYLNLSEFDAGVYHDVDGLVASTDYITQSGISLGSCADGITGSPIEISRFNSGAWADWQFNVPEDGWYNFIVRVSGMGEPTRFDPSLAVFGVDGDAETELAPVQTITLPNDNAVYKEISFPVQLKSGHRTIRLKDMAPYTPSGIRISAVRLSDATGIEGVSASHSSKVDVYSLQGILLRGGVEAETALDGLPAGVYIAGGKKIIK